jgi:flagellar biosynthesis protein FlhF
MGGWRAAALLEGSGFPAAQARRLEEELRRRHGERPPERLSDELDLARAVLAGWWRAPRQELCGRPHLLVGAPGVGKTTALCKWLTQVALGESRPARVWRLDAQGANMAEVLNVHCEILGVPVERCWRGDLFEGAPGEVQFLDVPGTDWRDGKALRGLVGQWERWGSPRVHLVVNGAYDVQVLLQQLRAFSILPIEDLIVTHLDEEARWGKIWNLTLGTNFCVRYFSAGQNIPGEFLRARPELVFARQFPA